jgi:hypothetical protein
MRDPQGLMSHMRDYTNFLSEIGQIPAEVLSAPMAVGKWSVQEMVAHIMAWDMNFLQTAVLPLEAGEKPRIADEEDFQAFNERAAAVGRQMPKDQLLGKAVDARIQLIEHLGKLSAETFQTKQQGRIDTDLAEFLERNFVSHDKSHLSQMRAYLASRRR